MIDGLSLNGTRAFVSFRLRTFTGLTIGSVEFSNERVIMDLPMETSLNRKNTTARVIRPGDSLRDDPDWEATTAEQRINAVWELTLLCLAWQGDRIVEPRLQRSISRIQRMAGEQQTGLARLTLTQRIEPSRTAITFNSREVRHEEPGLDSGQERRASGLPPFSSQPRVSLLQ